MLMRELFNPPSPRKKEYTSHNTVFREGDKIMQIHNNYDIEWHTADGREGSGVFNGDIGFIESIDTENQTVSLRFDDDRHAACVLPLLTISSMLTQSRYTKAKAANTARCYCRYSTVRAAL